MALSGKRKAAMLLTTLDTQTANELLKGQPHEVVQELAMELSHLEASGKSDDDGAIDIAKIFCTQLQQSRAGGMHVKSFVSGMLKDTAGKEKAAEAHAEMQKALREKDPFIAITAASAVQIAAALEGEPAQAVAIVVSSLPPKLGTDVLSRLNEEVGLKAVWRMARPGEISPRTMRRIGEVVCKRLVELTSDDQGMGFEETAPRDTLRKVALVLSGMTKEKRDVLLGEIESNDDQTASTVRALMVTWEDIPKIEDRSLQEALRKVDAGVLAKAMFGAEPSLVEKVRTNISERMADMVDEEAALMSEPRKKEIVEAREEVAKPLREANESENLAFIEDDE
jgi:flagellar motor switch protein FliG